MTDQPTAIERAFILAKSGDYATVSLVKRQLTIEGFGTSQITGATLQRQLRLLCQASATAP
jgi:hypothetical protein